MTETLTQPPGPAKVPATAHIIFHEAQDGYAEVIVDVTGAFVFRDKLKGHDFQFVRDRSEKMEAAVSLDRNGNRVHQATR